MIRPLRRAHRWISAGLAVVVPIAYAVILTLRPAAMSTPVAAESALPRIATTPGLRARLEPRADGGWSASLTMDKAAPDLLIYWSLKKTASLNGEAVLLGPLPQAAQIYALPGANAAGYLLIYSVAYQAVQAVVPVASLERAR